jgi:uncharacterized protein (TIGR00288 family)
MFEKVWDKLRKSKTKNVAVFIDGPNMLRKEFSLDLNKIKGLIAKLGVIKIGKVYLNQFAPSKLVEAVVNQGFEVSVCVSDIDVLMAVEATETVFNPNIDIICLVTRDSDFLPAIVKAKQHGKDVAVILVDESSGSALKNAADYVIILDKEKKGFMNKGN